MFAFGGVSRENTRTANSGAGDGAPNFIGGITGILMLLSRSSLKGGDEREYRVRARTAAAGAAEAVIFLVAVVVIMEYLIQLVLRKMPVIGAVGNLKALLVVVEKKSDSRPIDKRKVSDNFNSRICRALSIFKTSRLTFSADYCDRKWLQCH